MEEGLFQFLSLVPGLTRVHARRLAQRFQSFATLSEVALEDILRVEGMTPDLARRVREAVQSRALTAPAEAGLYICPSCGLFVSGKTDKCPHCGVVFEAGEERPEAKAELPAPPTEPIPEEVSDALRGIGIDTEKAKEIRDAKSRWEATPETQGLYLCSNCGGFIVASTKTCPTCGAPVEGEEQVPAPAEEIRAIQAPAGMPPICLHCGAFNQPGATVCGTCGKSMQERIEELPSPGMEEVIPKGFLPPRRKEPLAPEVPLPEEPAEKPVEVEAKPEAPPPVEAKPEAVPEAPPPAPVEAKPEAPTEPRPSPPVPPTPVPVPRPRRDRGVTRDFVRRWERVAEAREVSPRARLEEELEHWGRLLESDPDLERAWHRKAQILAELGRRAEAIEAFDRLAQLNPAREEEYRLEALDVTRALADVSPVPPRWTAEEPKDVAAITRALEHYDLLVAADPTLKVAWETRAELLRQMGREEEAQASEERALEADERLRRVSADGLVGLQTRSLLRAAQRMGRVNGLVNGMGGRVNGLVNGLGRVNGLVNGLGRVNGLVNGMGGGRVNGLAAVPVRRGLTNGLVNGDGFVNGRRGTVAERLASRTAWVRPTAGVAMTVAFMVLLPLLFAYLGQQVSPPGITVDGGFSDWSGTRSFADAATDVAFGPADITSYRVHRVGETLSAYVQTAGALFDGGPPDGVDSVYLFVDADGVAATGYALRGVGADFVVQVWGWDGRIQGTSLSEWTGTTSADDFNGFNALGAAVAARAGNVLEFQALVPGLGNFRALLAVTNNQESTDFADAVVTAAAPALVGSERWLAPDVLAGDGLVAALDFTATGGPAGLGRINLRLLGNVSASQVAFDLYADDGDLAYTANDPQASTASPQAGLVSFPLTATVDGAQRYFVAARFLGAAPTASVGLRLLQADSDGVVSLKDSVFSASYYLAAPAVTVDGAFGDWDPAALLADPDNDLVVRGPAGVNENIDLRAFSMNVSASVGVLFRVDGRVLAGIDIPYVRGRITPTPVLDSDRDGVPDNVEAAEGLDLAFDFNNDNVTDAQEVGDVDGDGVLDYDVGGPDLWLNTTIPAWFPAPYALRNATVYLGPLSPLVLEGVDTALAYLDADNRTDTGLPVTFQGVALGMDYAVEVRGRGQDVLDAGLFAFAPGRALPWTRVGDVSAALDSQRLEVGFPAGLVNLTADRRVVFYLRDASGSYDNSYSFSTRSAKAPPAPFNPAGTDVVINEVSPAPNPEWVEIANPTASPRSLSGCVLERRQGNNWQTLYTFTQTVGAWGGGSEYLAVSLGTNSLPNGGATIRLRCGGTEIDRTVYGNMPNGQTWSRFKDASTGKPTDTDNDANDFYADVTPTQGGPNTRHRPTIVVAKTRNVATSGPGGLITYTVYYNNTDTGRANYVWINDTLPAQVSFVSSSVPYSWFSGQTYRWNFTNVGPTTANSFTITARVGLAANGASLVNLVTLAYTDQLNRPRPGSVAWANVTVVRPVISVVKVSDVSTQVPGGFVVYTVYYSNTGSAAANNAWLNDTLPPQVTFVSSSVPPSSSSGQTYRWVFAGVAVGNHSFTITVQVNANATWGNQVNWAFLNYTSQFSYLLESSQDGATVYISEYDAVIVAIVVPGLFFGLRWHRRRGSAAEV